MQTIFGRTSGVIPSGKTVSWIKVLGTMLGSATVFHREASKLTMRGDIYRWWFNGVQKDMISQREVLIVWLSDTHTLNRGSPLVSVI